MRRSRLLAFGGPSVQMQHGSGDIDETRWKAALRKPRRSIPADDDCSRCRGVGIDARCCCDADRSPQHLRSLSRTWIDDVMDVAISTPPAPHRGARGREAATRNTD